MMVRKAHRRVAVAAIAVAGLLTAPGLTQASAAPAPQVPTPMHAAAQARQVSDRLGADSGGFFLDANQHAVVNVLNQSDAAAVRAAGATPRLVSYSMGSLTDTKNALDQLGWIKYSSWGIDPSTDQVVVTISDATPAAGARTLLAAARRFGPRVRIERSTDAPREFVLGGDAINNGQVRCSDGFNVRRGGQLMVLTAGHCTNFGGTWAPMGGRVVASVSPGADEGLITNPSGNGPSRINDGTTITSVGAPFVGERLRKSGSTTGITSGQVTGVNLTVNFDVGVIRHMFATTVHSAPGDSGGSGYDGSIALGTLTGGNSTTTFFYPAQREFADFGLTLP